MRNLSTGGQASNAFAQTSSLNRLQREFYSLEGGSEQPNSYKAMSTGDVVLPRPYAYVTSGSRTLGYKVYELKDHLGNVRATLSDVRMSTITPTGIGDFHPDVLSMTDYYAFGMEMPGRVYNKGGYRYGFQGQEMDNEPQGVGNSINYKYRVHDPRLGRFLSIDPLAPKYPHNSPYAFSENRVIDGVELEGLEVNIVVKRTFDDVMTRTEIKVTVDAQLVNMSSTNYNQEQMTQFRTYLVNQVSLMNQVIKLPLGVEFVPEINIETYPIKVAQQEMTPEFIQFNDGSKTQILIRDQVVGGNPDNPASTWENGSGMTFTSRFVNEALAGGQNLRGRNYTLRQRGVWHEFMHLMGFGYEANVPNGNGQPGSIPPQGVSNDDQNILQQSAAGTGTNLLQEQVDQLTNPNTNQTQYRQISTPPMIDSRPQQVIDNE